MPDIQQLNIDNIKFMKTQPDNAFDLAIVDIEYNIGASRPSTKPEMAKQKNGKYLKVKNCNKYKHKDWDDKLSSPEYFKELFRVSKRQIIFGGNYYGLSGGYLVWDKLNGECDQYGCELAWLSFTKRTDIVYYLWSGMMQGVVCSKNIREALKQIGNKKLNEERIHSTQKGIPLYKYLLQSYANKGDKILDTHRGSGSLDIACYDLGFDIVSCEIDLDYHNDSKARFEAHVANYAPVSEIKVNSEGQIKMF